MPAADLARALPGILVAGIVPGALLAAVLLPRRRWWEWLAVSPGLSAGLWGVLGLVEHDLRIPFEPATALPILLPLCLLAIRRVPGRPRPAVPRLALVAALAVGSSVAALALLTYHDAPLPPDNDTPVHAEVAAAIVSTHDAVPALPDPAGGGSWLRQRTGFEATAALTSELGGPAPAQTVAPLALAAVVLLPLGLAILALEITGSGTVAAVAPVAGLMVLMPAYVLSMGFDPALVDATLVVPVVLAVIRTLDDRDLPVHDVGMVAAATAAIWVIHGLEVAMVGLLALCFTLSRARSLRSLAAWRRLGAVTVAAAAGAVAVEALLLGVHVPASSGQPPLTVAAGNQGADFLASVHGHGLVDAVTVSTRLQPDAPWLVWLAGAAMLGTLIWGRRLRWLLAADVLLLAGSVDILTSGRLDAVWRHVFPLSDPPRLVAFRFWTLPIMVAALSVPAAGALVRRASTVQATRLRTIALGAAGTLLAVTGLAGARTQFVITLTNRGVLASADLHVLDAMAQRLRPGALVLTDGFEDAGQWINLLTPDRVYLVKGYTQGHVDDPRITMLAHACDNPAGAAAQLTAVDAVFVGDPERGEVEPRWSADCVARIPGLVLIAREGGAAAFAVPHP